MRIMNVDVDKCVGCNACVRARPGTLISSVQMKTGVKLISQPCAAAVDPAEGLAAFSIP